MTTFPVDNIAEPQFGFQVGPGILENVHPAEQCAGHNCVFHNPSDHHMREWKMNWRGDKGLVERTCEHGVGHPDPDSQDYYDSIGEDWKGVHGCDGCCRGPA